MEETVGEYVKLHHITHLTAFSLAMKTGDYFAFSFAFRCFIVALYQCLLDSWELPICIKIKEECLQFEKASYVR